MPARYRDASGRFARRPQSRRGSRRGRKVTSVVDRAVEVPTVVVAPPPPIPATVLTDRAVLVSNQSSRVRSGVAMPGNTYVYDDLDSFVFIHGRRPGDPIPSKPVRRAAPTPVATPAYSVSSTAVVAPSPAAGGTSVRAASVRKSSVRTATPSATEAKSPGAERKGFRVRRADLDRTKLRKRLIPAKRNTYEKAYESEYAVPAGSGLYGNDKDGEERNLVIERIESQMNNVINVKSSIAKFFILAALDARQVRTSEAVKTWEREVAMALRLYNNCKEVFTGDLGTPEFATYVLTVWARWYVFNVWPKSAGERPKNPRSSPSHCSYDTRKNGKKSLHEVNFVVALHSGKHCRCGCWGQYVLALAEELTETEGADLDRFIVSSEIFNTRTPGNRRVVGLRVVDPESKESVDVDRQTLTDLGLYVQSSGQEYKKYSTYSWVHVDADKVVVRYTGEAPNPNLVKYYNLGDKVSLVGRAADIGFIEKLKYMTPGASTHLFRSTCFAADYGFHDPGRVIVMIYALGRVFSLDDKTTSDLADATLTIYNSATKNKGGYTALAKPGLSAFAADSVFDGVFPDPAVLGCMYRLLVDSAELPGRT